MTDKVVPPDLVGLPDPIIPSGVDLRDFAFTPIYRSRLFGSSFHARVNDAEWRAGVTLWLKSWDQVPAGSIPNDDVDLCRLAELGRDLRTWRKVKKGALHGWFLCNDGRLYHHVVAEVVVDAHERRLVASEKGKAGARKRWKSGNATAKKSSGTGNGPGNATAIARAMPGDSKGQGQGQGTDRDSKTQEARARDGIKQNTPEIGAVDDPNDREAFAKLKATYPPGTYLQSDWLVGEHDARNRVREGCRWSELQAGVDRFVAQLQARGKVGSEYVYSPKNFFTAREKRFLEEFPIPRSKGERQQDENVAAGQAWLRESGATT